MTADFIGSRLAPLPFPARERVSIARHLDPIILDHRIGEQLFRRGLERGFRAGAIGAFDFDVEDFALADAGDTADAERLQGALNGLALRIEDAGFQRDGDARFHGHLNM